MEYGAIDLHKKESQIRIVTERGETFDRRIATTRERFTALFHHTHFHHLQVQARKNLASEQALISGFSRQGRRHGR